MTWFNKEGGAEPSVACLIDGGKECGVGGISEFRLTIFHNGCVDRGKCPQVVGEEERVALLQAVTMHMDDVVPLPA